MADYALAISDVELRRYRLMATAARQAEAELWRRAGVVPGARVADVGCGPAAVTVMLADDVAPDGRVVGVERDPSALDVARHVVAQSGMTNVALHQASAVDTGLAAGSFDVVMCRHVLGHNGSAEQQIVDHLASLARAGGAVYLVDVDVTALRTLDAPPELAELNEAYLAFHRALGNDLQTGLRLGRLLANAGLEVEAFEGRYTIIPAPPGLRPPSWAARDAMVAAGVITATDVDRIGRAFETFDGAAHRPTLFTPLFVGVGRTSADDAHT